MKGKWLASLLAAIGLAQPAAAAEKLQTVDPKSIMFTVPTISNDLAPLDPIATPPQASEPQMHEDDWCQVEFFRKSYLPELERILKEYKAFESSNRQMTKVQGKEYPVWRNTYVRTVAREPLVLGNEALSQLAKIVGAKPGPAAALFSSSSWSGRVKDGFTLVVGRSVELYGYSSSGDIPVLGASVGENPDDQALVKAFASLNASLGLVLVDWRSQFILVGVNSDGKVQAWRP
ncbi:hypothetical protein [Nodularia spumigena]|uniref:hypothetical protein n=1 Tax=Nodularia spumigena TaxID=70799 RepID=UPI002B21E4A3|nr:hypothetical protein [Nodularia spumigena]MEA5559509.1 hypothetical protein [Nodularia spumigena CH309]